MSNKNSSRLTKADWLQAALKILADAGIESVKIVPLAKQLGVTSGSFYWHFHNRPELYQALLDYWEREMTVNPLEAAKSFQGPPEERIWRLMERVMDTGLAKYDIAVWHWAQFDSMAHEVFTRSINKRFSLCRWMFEQAGFDKVQAEVRSRMMVIYMMGESTLLSGLTVRRKELLKLKYEILIAS
jgi:AcrR family transcriptional regulator